jgi:hypothetical protein
MPRRGKGPRLWLQPARRDRLGQERPVWVIRDRAIKRSTGAGEGEIEQAEAALADYIISKSKAPRAGNRHTSVVTIADVVSIYTDDIVSAHARPNETAARLERVLDHFGDRTLAHLNARSRGRSQFAVRGATRTGKRDFALR